MKSLLISQSTLFIVFVGFLFIQEASADQTHGTVNGYTTVTIDCRSVGEGQHTSSVKLGIPNEACSIVLSDGSKWDCSDCEMEMQQDERCQIVKVIKAANGCVPAGGQKHTPAFFPPEKKRLMRQLKGEMDNDGNRGMQRPNYSQPRDS